MTALLSTLSGSINYTPPVPVTKIFALQGNSYSGSGPWVDSIAGKSFTLYNNPTWSDTNGGQFRFDARSKQYGDTGDGTSLPSLDSFTVQAVFKTHSIANVSPFTVVANGVTQDTYDPRSFTRTEPFNYSFLPGVNSAEGYTGGAHATARAVSPNGSLAKMGLVGTANLASNVDFGFEVSYYGGLIIIEDGATYSTSYANPLPDPLQLKVIYDGTDVKYYVNDNLIRTSTKNITDPLHFAAHYYYNSTFDNVYFGPMGPYGPINGLIDQTGACLITENWPGISKINYALGFINSTTSIDAGFFDNNAGFWNTIQAIANPTPDTWYNVVISYKKATKQLKAYLPGVTYSTTVNGTAVSASDNKGIRIARRWDNENYFDCTIKDITIWDGALSPSEAASQLALYNSLV